MSPRDAAFQEAYWITSSRSGRIYTRAELRRYVDRYCRKLFASREVRRAALALLDDPAWMRRHRREVPEAVAHDAWLAGLEA